MKKILVTGALGQIGTALVAELRKQYGEMNVIATDIKFDTQSIVCNEGNFDILDVMDVERFEEIVKEHEIDTLIHLAALLSAVAENYPKRAWDLNMGGLINALEIARKYDLKFFTPSSIGAFGPGSPADNTPQDTIQRPTTMYGVTKVSGEILCDYYYTKYGVDTRGVRFPGLISYEAPPGGGTTDYAVEIYYEALRHKKYTSYIGEGTYMDMLYMPDAVEAIIKLMEADPDKLVHRNAFNVSGMSFEPSMIAESIKKVIPDFEIDYDVDPARQAIADSWPNSLDVTCAKDEWGFDPQYDLDAMTRDMLEKLGKRMPLVDAQ